MVKPHLFAPAVPPHSKVASIAATEGAAADLAATLQARDGGA